MHKNLTTLGLAAAGFVASTSLLNADVNDSQMRNLENRVSALEQKKGASGMVNPSGRPQVKDGADLFITADWLIWQAKENGLGYVIKNDSTSTTNLADADIKNPAFDWDFGFRVGLGWNTPHDGWDLYANWTWFDTHASDHTHAGSSKHLFPVYAHPFEVDNGVAQNSEAHWRLHLNMIDLELGREFFVSKWVTLRPFVGLRNAWVRQKFDCEYEQISHSGSLQEAEVEMVNNYWGLGLRTGLNTQWGLGAGFSIYGNAAISLLYGFFHLEQEQEQTIATVESTFMDLEQSYHIDRAISELALGIRWDHMFSDDNYHFGIQAGWEHLMFWGQNQMQRFVSFTTLGEYVANQGDLTIQGWTVSARFDF